jgi:cyclopropane fatty-acyl-phospholipid synthase-like methyltransferase
MNRRQDSIPARYFEDLYAGERDPWEFETSAYEQAKYDATLAALPRPRYRHGLEIGCSIGVLTARLASRCASLLAIDVSERALDAARVRCRGLANIQFENIGVPGEWPAGSFDLIMLSEVIYYFDAGDVSRLAERVRASVEPGGHAVLVHWTGTTDYPLSGDDAAELFMTALGRSARLVRQERTQAYRLDALAFAQRPV